MQLDINKSLEMNTAVYGEHTNHSDIALSYDNVGNVHTQLGNYDTALEHYTKSRKMLEAVYGEGSAHPNLRAVNDSISHLSQLISRSGGRPLSNP